MNAFVGKTTVQGLIRWQQGWVAVRDDTSLSTQKERLALLLFYLTFFLIALFSYSLPLHIPLTIC